MTLLMDYIHIEVSQGPPFCSQFMLVLYKSTLRVQAAKVSDLSSRQELRVAGQSTTATADNEETTMQSGGQRGKWACRFKVPYQSIHSSNRLSGVVSTPTASFIIVCFQVQKAPHNRVQFIQFVHPGSHSVHDHHLYILPHNVQELAGLPLYCSLQHGCM